MHIRLKPFLTLSLIIVCHIVFAQSKKPVKSFKLGTVSYTLFESRRISKTDNDTTFYLLYKTGKSKIVAKEIKTIYRKSSSTNIAAATYKINKNSIVFYQSLSNAFYHRIYTQQKNGSLSFKNNFIENIREEPLVPTPVKPVPTPDYGGTGDPISVDILPEFPGGMAALRKFIGDNLQYPDAAQEAEASGTVYVRFVVTKDGSIANIQIERKLGYGCEEEVIRILKRMPKWAPGRLNGKAVNCQFRLPVTFALQ